PGRWYPGEAGRTRVLCVGDPRQRAPVPNRALRGRSHRGPRCYSRACATRDDRAGFAPLTDTDGAQIRGAVTGQVSSGSSVWRTCIERSFYAMIGLDIPTRAALRHTSEPRMPLDNTMDDQKNKALAAALA